MHYMRSDMDGILLTSVMFVDIIAFNYYYFFKSQGTPDNSHGGIQITFGVITIICVRYILNPRLINKREYFLFVLFKAYIH